LVIGLLAAGAGGLLFPLSAAEQPRKTAAPPVVRSARSGAWSAPATWEGAKVPTAGARVLIRTGHQVVYDLRSDQALRSVHVAGALRLAPDKDTRLDVGLIAIQASEKCGEEGFDCEAHLPTAAGKKPRPALLVGTPERPIDARHTARIRLVYFRGMDKASLPAIICCGGQMDFHGTPMKRTWVKLGTTAKKGDNAVTLAEPVTGWKVGDRIIVTMTGVAPSSGYPHP